MMSKDGNQKTEGKVILGNYKKQLAEKLVRDKTEAGEKLKDGGASEMDIASSLNKYGQFDFNPNDPPEPEVLLAILDPKKRS